MIVSFLKSLFAAPAIVRAESLALPKQPVLLNRRGFLTGLTAAVAAPLIVRPESIMPVRVMPISTIFLDRPYTGFSPWAEVDQFLLDELTREAGGLQIRHPRFLSYQTLADAGTLLREHRRCVVELVDAPWLKRET